MESSVLGLILDSSIVIDAERNGLTVAQLLQAIREPLGEVEIAISAVSLAELVHGVMRANSPQLKHRRREFIDELKRHVPVHSVSENTAEIAGRIGGQQAAIGVNLPSADLLIAASAIEQGYGVATLNLRHFQQIPDLKVYSTLGRSRK